MECPCPGAPLRTVRKKGDRAVKTIVVVPWHNGSQLELFLSEWKIGRGDPRLLPVQDKDRSGCAATKNKGIEEAITYNAETIIILDDDCFPDKGMTFDEFIHAHEKALEPQEINLFQAVTEPPSRGTPYFSNIALMEVAASMGFWTGIGDYDACGQLVHGATKPMRFLRNSIHGRYFPLCGMNLAFRAKEWPWCQFIDVERFDDIWQGFLWQRRAYADGKCFNLNGPLVRHSRQSDVWANLRAEAVNLEENETLWQRAATLPLTDYKSFRQSVLMY